jgi:DNA-binding transcriptional LysR family regulator
MARATWDWEARIGRRVRLRDLHILSAVVRWGSMAKAASHLSMSQSSVSEAIASLEDALRVQLLDRNPHGIEPTIYANALLKRGHAVFDELVVAPISQDRRPSSANVHHYGRIPGAARTQG